MNKADLITDLQGKFFWVGTPISQGQHGNWRYYTVPVLDLAGDIMVDGTVGFYVIDEGLAGEVAKWSKGEPKAQKPLSSLNKVQAFITSKIADNTIQHASIETIDALNLTAIVKVVMTGTLAEERYLIDNNTGSLRIRKL